MGVKTRTPEPFGTAPTGSANSQGQGIGARAWWARGAIAGFGPARLPTTQIDLSRAARYQLTEQALTTGTGIVVPLVFDGADYDALGLTQPAIWTAGVNTGASSYTTYAPPTADVYRLHARVAFDVVTGGDLIDSAQLELATSLDGTTWTPLDGTQSAIGAGISGAILETDTTQRLDPQLGFSGTPKLLTAYLRVRAQLRVTCSVVANIHGAGALTRPTFLLARRVR